MKAMKRLFILVLLLAGSILFPFKTQQRKQRLNSLIHKPAK